MKLLKNQQTSIIILLVIIGIYMIMSKKEGADNTDDPAFPEAETCVSTQPEINSIQQYNPDTNTTEDVDIAAKNAQEMCSAIADKAKEIATAMENTKDRNTGETLMDGLSNITSFMNPENYTGDSTSVSMMSNIVNTNLSSEDRAAINSACSNVNTTVQLNEISTGDCPYCQENGCHMTGIVQENISTSKQTCGMSVAIEKLRNKKNNIDAQALAEVLQKQQGVLTGNQSSVTSNCSAINTDMSSSDFLNVSNCCSNVNQVSQTNRINDTCGSLTNVIQRNVADNEQACLIDQNMVTASKTESKTSLKSMLKNIQESTGITAGASIASSIVSMVVAGGGAFFMMSGGKRKY